MRDSSYRYLWRGCLPAAAIAVDCDPRQPPRAADLAERIAADWRRRLAAAETAGIHLFDGPVLNYQGHVAAEDRLRIRGRSDHYAAWLYCCGRQDEIAAEFGPEASCRPLALCAAIFTADGYLLLQERSHRVAEGAGMLHVPGGHLDPTRHGQVDAAESDLTGTKGDAAAVVESSGGAPVAGRPSASLDPQRAMGDELFEELALRAEDFMAADEDSRWGGGRLLGLAEAVASRKPELLFAYHCRLDAAALERRAEGGQDRFEYEGLRFAPASPPALSAWVASRRLQLAPPSRALVERLLELNENSG